jgi:hypothetical protein
MPADKRRILEMNIQRIELNDHESDATIVFVRESEGRTWRMIKSHHEQSTEIMTEMMTSSVLAVIGRIMDRRGSLHLS